MKWETVRKDPCSIKYLCCNAAEGEPGTFKDRALLLKNPYQMLEGLLVAAQAIGVKESYVALKRRFKPETARVRSALEEMEKAGWAKKGAVKIVLGPDDYLFGEEKALLEVIEGHKALPRVLPPYIEGLFRGPNSPNPTVVNNVETLCNVPHILRNGADWFAGIGPISSPGTMVFTLCGDVKKPGVYELPMGTPLQELIDRYGGGPSGPHKLLAAFSGVSNAVLTAGEFGTPMDFDSMKAKGTGLGSGGFIVYDESVCMVRAALLFSSFLAAESCGQCVPCKLGCDEITARLKELERGKAAEGDLAAIRNQCGLVEDGKRCYLPTAENVLVSSLLRKFPDDFKSHTKKACASRRKISLPLIEAYDPEEKTFRYQGA